MGGQGRGHQRREGPLAQGGPEQGTGGEAGRGPRGDAQEQQEQDAGLEDREVLGEGRGQRRTAEARDGVQRLDGDGAAGEADDDQAELRQQSGQGAVQRVPCDAAAGQSARGGGPRPWFGERGGQRVVQQPAEEGARRDAHGECGQYQLLGRAPAERREPAELYGDDGGQDGGEQELRQRGEDGGARPGPCGDDPPPGPAPQRARAERGGQQQGDGERDAHQGQGDAERGRHLGGDGLSGDPGGAEVAVEEAAQPVAQDVCGPAVEPGLGADRVEGLGGGRPVGVPGVQDRERRVVPGQPGQQPDDGEDREERAEPPGQVLHPVTRRGCRR